MVLEDRTGKNDATFLTQNVYKFLAAAAKRPEIAAVIPTYYPSVPQLKVEVNKEKVSQQQVQLNDVYTALSAFLGGDLVNYFNRFGRQWQTYGEAEGNYRQDIKNIDQLYVQSANGSRVPLSSLVTVKRRVDKLSAGVGQRHHSLQFATHVSRCSAAGGASHGDALRRPGRRMVMVPGRRSLRTNL